MLLGNARRRVLVGSRWQWVANWQVKGKYGFQSGSEKRENIGFNKRVKSKL